MSVDLTPEKNLLGSSRTVCLYVDDNETVLITLQECNVFSCVRFSIKMHGILKRIYALFWDQCVMSVSHIFPVRPTRLPNARQPLMPL